MITATVKIEGLSPYSQSRQIFEEKKKGELADAFDLRTWPRHLYTNQKGQVMIPSSAMKQAIDAAAKYLSIQVPGKGKATYTKHFRSGVMVFDPAVVMDEEGAPWTRERILRGGEPDDLENLSECIAGGTVFRGAMAADGVRGSGKRVVRTFPVIPDPWTATLTFYVGDPVIDKAVFLQSIQAAGSFIGLGRFRPENGGSNGRFRIASLAWEETDMEASADVA